MTDKFLARRAVLDRREADDRAEQRAASLTLADRAADKDELLRWLDMLGLPPCERPLRSAEKWKAKR